MLLTKDQIIAARDLTTTDLEVPEWGGTVRVSMLSGAARDALQADFAESKAVSHVQAVMIAATVVDENGAPLFTKDEIETIRSKGTAPLERVFKAAVTLNKLGAAETEKAGKNSEAAQSGDSGTA
ncbi:hypothetical protein OVY01_00055 [Robbsia sp. Bb-Pol-6]|uniref:Phage tail protein n=1 Tax=Robbsia betulipollinis TaxID=2981849 RepID=A0ABT3ZGV7_9BURK|nr:hypothetical protein [Robbsia betulipollinis]MCY0385657.1 hypothetical protein [Robbsia betulipollinis]